MERTTETKLGILEERLKNMNAQNSADHLEIIGKLDKLCNKFDDLPNKFPTRVEYNTVSERVKTVENILKGVGMTCGLAILGALLKLIIS